MLQEEKEKDSRKRKIWVWYTLIYVIFCVVIFSQFILYDKTLIWIEDGYTQWYAVIAKLKHMVLDYIQGRGFSFWSWDTGLGSDVIGSFANVIFDPFNYLAVVFPDAYLDVAYTVIVILKLYFAGAAMMVFLRYHKKQDMTCLVCSFGYAFSMWAVICLRHDFFITSLILFPLIILGIDKIEDKKSSLTLILSVAASLITSLYFSYMTAIFAVIYVVVKYFAEKTERTVKDFIGMIMRYIGYVLVSVMISAAALVPCLYALTQSSTGSGIERMLLPNLKILLRYIPAYLTTCDINTNYSIVGTNAFFVLMIPAMFLFLKKRITNILMFFISAAVVLLPFAQSIMNGGSYASGRWGYIFCFFFAAASAECFERQPWLEWGRTYKRNVLILYAVMAVMSFLACVFFHAITLKDVAFVMLNLLFGLTLLYFVIRGKKPVMKNPIKWKRFGVIALTNIALMPMLFHHPYFGAAIDSYMDQGKCYENYESTALQMGTKVADDDFYRVNTVDYKNNKGVVVREMHTMISANIYWNVPSVSEYLSTLPNNWQKFNTFVNNSAGTYRRVSVHSNDNRSALDFLLGVKYFAADEWDDTIENPEEFQPQSIYKGYGFSKVLEKENMALYQSPYKPALGYVMDNVLTEQELATAYNPLEREQALLQCVSVQNKKGIETEGDLNKIKTSSISHPISVYDKDDMPVENKKFVIRTPGEMAKIKFDDTIKDSEVYVVFKGLKKKKMQPLELWNFLAEGNQPKTEIEKRRFLSQYLSYIPYGDMTIRIQKDEKIKRLVNASGEAQGVSEIEDYTINLGYFKQCSGEVQLIFDKAGEFTYDSLEIVSVPTSIYRKNAKELSRNRLKITKNDGDYLKGTIHAKKDGMLFLSIPYYAGWQIFIDGKRAENVYCVDHAFTGVPVLAGKHKIEMKYRPIGYHYTLIISLLGAIITIIIAIWEKKKGRKDESL